MNKRIQTFCLAATLASLLCAGFAQTPACNSGRLLDVQVSTRLIDGGTTERVEEKMKKSGREYHSYSMPLTQEQTVYTVTVELSDLVYTAQSQPVFGMGFKPTAFIVNDPIRGCIRGNTLALIRPDGKEYKARIVRVEREIAVKPSR